jgi:hypothetical protein
MAEDPATLRFVQAKANVLMVGPPGVGKTMLPWPLATGPWRPATGCSTPPPPT